MNSWSLVVTGDIFGAVFSMPSYSVPGYRSRSPEGAYYHALFILRLTHIYLWLASSRERNTYNILTSGHTVRVRRVRGVI